MHCAKASNDVVENRNMENVTEVRLKLLEPLRAVLLIEVREQPVELSTILFTFLE